MKLIIPELDIFIMHRDIKEKIEKKHRIRENETQLEIWTMTKNMEINPDERSKAVTTLSLLDSQSQIILSLEIDFEQTEFLRDYLSSIINNHNK